MALAITDDVSAQDGDELRTAALVLFGVVAPVTDDEIRDPRAVLGQALFWDARLSASGNLACASCHLPELWGADDRPFSINARGAETSRHAQTVFNSQEAPAGLRWIGDRPTGQAQAIGSITGSMGFANVADIVPVLLQHGYRRLFEFAFPDDIDPVSVERYGQALQAYEETLRTPAPFDQWLLGEDTAMTDQEIKGLKRFIQVGCVSCHNGPLLGGTMLKRFGTVDEYWKHTGSTDVDLGLMQSTGNESDRYVFRVQPLRNVSRTAPYFHDGSVADLEVATRIMGRVQLGRELTGAEVEDLVAFQRALAGDVPTAFRAPEWLESPVTEKVQ